MKRSFLIICSLIFLFCIASVVANDLNETEMVSVDQSNELISVENQDDNNVFSVEENDDIINIDDNHIISEIENTGSVGTFTDLSTLINDTPEGDTLKLNFDYRYVNGSTEGIFISKSIIIDGGGHKIDGSDVSSIFKIQANDVTLKNISFINAHTNSQGGAINWLGNNGIVINCSFNNNFASKSGGAIYIQGENTQITSCVFTKNSVTTSSSEGGAIYWKGKLGSLLNCSFIHNSAYGGSALSLYSNNANLINCYFINNSGVAAASAIYCNSYNCNFTRCYFINNSASQLAGAIFTSNNNNNFNNCVFIRNSANDGGAIIIKGTTNFLVNCIFKDNHANRYGGAIYLTNNYCSFKNCSFTNNSADYGGAILLQGNNTSFNNSSFINNHVSSWGGAIYWMGKNGILTNSSFIDNMATLGGSIFWRGDNGNLVNSTFISNIVSTTDDVIYWYGNNGKLINSTFTNNINSTQIVWHSQSGTIMGCMFLNITNGNVINSGANFIKRNIGFTYSNVSFEYKCPKATSIYITNILNNLPIKSKIIFNCTNGVDVKTFNVDLLGNTASICDELVDFKAGDWKISVIFEGDDNYYFTNTTFILKINPAYSLLNIQTINTTAGHKTNITITIVDSNNSAINEGVVIFFDDETNIGNANVVKGVATLNYIPYNGGEHPIKAIFNSDNYLSSNNTVKLFVDSANVSIMVDSGIVGFNSTFVANVNGIYSIINEGAVSFYINNDYLGKEKVINGSASLVYMPLTTGNYTIKVVYSEGVNFLDDTNATKFIVNKADSKLVLYDVKGTIGHELVLTAYVCSSNNFTINEGYITFYDAEKNIGKSNVVNGIANLTYIPTTAGNHTITAVYNSNSYLTSDNNLKLLIEKDLTVLTSSTITAVYHGNGKLIATLKDSQGNPISGALLSVNLNGLKSLITDNEGQVNLSTNDLTPNTYVAVITFEGNANYINSTTNVKVIVTKATPEMAIQTSGEGSIKIQLPNDAKGTITLIVSNKPDSFLVTNGVCNIGLSDLANGDYSYTITYSGDELYSSLSKTGKLTINKPQQKTTPAKPVTKTTLSLKKVTVKKSAKKLVLQATLKQGKNPIKNKKITFKFNGKKYTAKTNKKGIAKVTIKKAILKKLKVGKKIKYQASYGKIIAKKTAKVKK